jgi:drug/metabolite transporter (DMT)-like permease
LSIDRSLRVSGPFRATLIRLSGEPASSDAGSRVVASPAAVVGAALLAVVLWGGSPIATKLAVAGLDPLAVGGLRTLIGAVPAALILMTGRLAFPRSASGRRLLAVSSLSGFVVFPLLFSLALERTSGSHGGLALALLPITTALIAAGVERRLPPRRWWLGAAVALAGTLLLVDRRFGMSSPGASLEGDLLVLVSCFAASAGYVAGGRAAREVGAPAVTFWGVVLGAVMLLPVTPVLIPAGAVARLGASDWAALIYLGVMISIVGYLAWYWALAQGDMTRIALMQFLQPGASLVFAAVVLGEVVTWPLALAGGIIVAGVALAQSGRIAPAVSKRASD